MANRSITQLQVANYPLTGMEVIPLVQGGITKQALVADIAALGGAITISNDTATATNLYPTFVNVTSGTATNLYTANPEFLFKPATGELSSPEIIASNGLLLNANVINTNYTIAATNNALSAGPITVAGGVVVTTSPGAVWTVV